MNNGYNQIILLLLQLCSIQTIQIDIPFFIHQNKTIYSHISIGKSRKDNPPQAFLIELDTGSSNFWVREYNDDVFRPNFDSGFISNLSFTFKNRTIFTQVKLIYGTVTGFEVEDTIALGPLSLLSYPFILANNIRFTWDIDGIMGLSFSNETNSLISVLHSSHQINYKIFSFDMKRHMFTIGVIPNAIQNNIKHFSYCRVPKEINREANNRWKCILTGVHVKGNSTNFLNNDHQIEFNTGTSSVLVDFKILYGLYLHLISKYQKGECRLESKVRINQIVCTKDLIINNLTDLYLQIDKMTIRIPKEDLFIETADSNGYIFMLKAIPNDSHWIIGYPLLKYFHSVFDMDRGIVGLYSERNIINEYDIDNDEIIKAYKNANRFFKNIIVLSLIMFVCIIGSIINCIHKLKKEDHFLLVI